MKLARISTVENSTSNGLHSKSTLSIEEIEVRAANAANFVKEVHLRKDHEESTVKKTSISYIGGRNKSKVSYTSYYNQSIQIGGSLLSKTDIKALSKLPRDIQEIKLTDASNLFSAAMLIKAVHNINELNFNSYQCCVNLIASTEHWFKMTLHNASFYMTNHRLHFFNFKDLVELNLFGVSFKTKNLKQRMYRSIKYATNLKKISIIEVRSSKKLKPFTIKGVVSNSCTLPNVCTLFALYLPKCAEVSFTIPWVTRRRHSVFLWNQFYKTRCFSKITYVHLPKNKLGKRELF